MLELLMNPIVMSLLIGNIVLIGLLILFTYLGKNEIFATLKTKLGKGMAYVFLFGNDNRLYLLAKKFSRKDKKRATTDIDGNPYVMDRSKVKYYKDTPTFIFEEGKTTPIDIDEGEVKSSGLTPELFKQAIIVARQSGQMPGEDKMERIKTIAILVAAGAACVAAWFAFDTSSKMKNLPQQFEQLATIIRGVKTAVTNSTAA